MVIERLDQIRHFWEHYVWKYKSIQSAIDFSTEVRLNYFGDILAYFYDTLPLIEKYPSQVEVNPIIGTTGFLQILFVHQDMVDETMKIFHLNPSEWQDKSKIRKLRNELVGHPINREKQSKKFESSIFFGNGLSTELINYIKYTPDKPNGEKKSISVAKILEWHSEYLNKYFGQIISEIEKIIEPFRSNLVDILISIEQDSVGKVVDKVIENFEGFLDYSELYTRDYLVEIEARCESHPRYKNALSLFKRELKENINDCFRSIKEITDPSQKVYPKNSEDVIEFESIDLSILSKDEVDEIRKRLPENHSYMFSKLNGVLKDVALEHFQTRFKDDVEIVEEVEHMKSNLNNSLEYNCSRELLRTLIPN